MARGRNRRRLTGSRLAGQGRASMADSTLRTADAAGGPSPELARRLRGATFGLLVALLIQFLAGMLVNLFVTVPAGHAGSNSSEYFSGSFQSVIWAITQSGLPVLVFRAALGLLLVLGALALIPRARAMRRRAVTVLAVLGFLFVLGAGFNGASFLDFAEDFSSMIMAALFALAMLCYVALLYVVPGTG